MNEQEEHKFTCYKTTDIISREYSIDDHFSESLFERYKSRKHSSAVRNSSTSAMRLGAVYYSIAKPKITLPQSHVAATAREPWRDVGFDATDYVI